MYKKLLDRVSKEIHGAKNREKYTMNGFVISIATYIEELTEKATKTAEKIGVIEVDMNGTACKVPFAKDYIQKVIDKQRRTDRQALTLFNERGHQSSFLPLHCGFFKLKWIFRLSG